MADPTSKKSDKKLEDGGLTITPAVTSGSEKVPSLEGAAKMAGVGAGAPPVTQTPVNDVGLPDMKLAVPQSPAPTPVAESQISVASKTAPITGGIEPVPGKVDVSPTESQTAPAPASSPAIPGIPDMRASVSALPESDIVRKAYPTSAQQMVGELAPTAPEKAQVLEKTGTVFNPKSNMDAVNLQRVRDGLEPFNKKEYDAFMAKETAPVTPPPAVPVESKATPTPTEAKTPTASAATEGAPTPFESYRTKMAEYTKKQDWESAKKLAEDSGAKVVEQKDDSGKTIGIVTSGGPEKPLAPKTRTIDGEDPAKVLAKLTRDNEVSDIRNRQVNERIKNNQGFEDLLKKADALESAPLKYTPTNPVSVEDQKAIAAADKTRAADQETSIKQQEADAKERDRKYSQGLSDIAARGAYDELRRKEQQSADRLANIRGDENRPQVTPSMTLEEVKQRMAEGKPVTASPVASENELREMSQNAKAFKDLAATIKPSVGGTVYYEKDRYGNPIPGTEKSNWAQLNQDYVNKITEAARLAKRTGGRGIDMSGLDQNVAKDIETLMNANTPQEVAAARAQVSSSQNTRAGSSRPEDIKSLQTIQDQEMSDAVKLAQATNLTRTDEEKRAETARLAPYGGSPQLQASVENAAANLSPEAFQIYEGLQKEKNMTPQQALVYARRQDESQKLAEKLYTMGASKSDVESFYKDGYLDVNLASAAIGAKTAQAEAFKLAAEKDKDIRSLTTEGNDKGTSLARRRQIFGDPKAPEGSPERLGEIGTLRQEKNDILQNYKTNPNRIQPSTASQPSAASSNPVRTYSGKPPAAAATTPKPNK